ncbi:MAG: hypothetical protein WAK28_17660 [Trebonia sp.]
MEIRWSRRPRPRVAPKFGMLRQALVRDQARLYAAQSALISVLAVVIAASRNLPDLYALAALSGALKVVVVPLVLRRLLGAPVSEDAPGVDSRSGGVMTWNGSPSPGVEPAVLVRRPPPRAPRVFTYDANVPVLR